jgi:hypothetical protein
MSLLLAATADDVFATIMTVVLIALMLAYVPLQILALVKLRGGWLIAAVALLVAFAAYGAFVLIRGAGNLTHIVIGAGMALAAALLLPLLRFGWPHRPTQPQHHRD